MSSDQSQVGRGGRDLSGRVWQTRTNGADKSSSDLCGVVKHGPRQTQPLQEGGEEEDRPRRFRKF